MTERQLKERTKKFAHDCVRFSRTIASDFLGNHIARQLIRCSTSVAANYRAACLTQSKVGFIAKLSIVVEEADESNFWLEFINDENMSKAVNLDGLIQESKELTMIFVASRKTAQLNNKNK